MTYEQALQFWFSRINFEKLSPRRSDLKLDRMRALLELLQNPHQDLPIVHIAGSKGKGSTAAMLAAILTQAGYRTGLFTSPHLTRVEERIQINGEFIGEQDLADLMGEVAEGVYFLDGKKNAEDQGVTFFEIVTALGFLHFRRKKVDLAVMEVGLGGRFDATNVCQPLLAIISSISIDHTLQLGNTLSSIAREKAGIIKPGCYVLSGVRQPEPRQKIEEISSQQKAQLYQLDRDFTYRYFPCLISAKDRTFPQLQVETKQRKWPVCSMGLLGEHQATNAALAIAAVEKLNREGFTIPDDAVSTGLREVQWPARLEVIGRKPFVILDCAHNLASVEALVKTLQTSFALESRNGPLNTRPGQSQRFLIFSGSQDKDLSGMLKVLVPEFDHILFTELSNNPRVASAEQLTRLLWEHSSPPSSNWKTPEQAWQQALKWAGSSDLICATGSVFLAGELRPLMMEQAQSSSF